MHDISPRHSPSGLLESVAHPKRHKPQSTAILFELHSLEYGQPP